MKAHHLTVSYREEGQEKAFSQEESSETSEVTGTSPSMLGDLQAAQKGMTSQALRSALVFQLDPTSAEKSRKTELGKMTDESGSAGEDTNLEYLYYRPARSSHPRKLITQL